MRCCWVMVCESGEEEEGKGDEMKGQRLTEIRGA